MKLLLCLSTLLLISFSQAADHPAGQRNGQVLIDGQTQPLAWSTANNKWVFIEDFWLEHANSDNRRHWGSGRTYPPYAKVNETDTFMVRTKQGNCLMEFWHSRWRRANDVRRWDEKFNEYGGCPIVFD